MLVLSRRTHERIVFPTLGASVEVVAVKPGVVRLGIEAPPNVPVFRQEVLDRDTEAGRAPPPPSADALLDELTRLLRARLDAGAAGADRLRRQIGQARAAARALDRIEGELRGLRDGVGEDAAEVPTPASSSFPFPTPEGYCRG